MLEDDQTDSMSEPAQSSIPQKEITQSPESLAKKAEHQEQLKMEADQAKT
jgi:hypothetical protein